MDPVARLLPRPAAQIQVRSVDVLPAVLQEDLASRERRLDPNGFPRESEVLERPPQQLRFDSLLLELREYVKVLPHWRRGSSAIRADRKGGGGIASLTDMLPPAHVLAMQRDAPRGAQVRKLGVHVARHVVRRRPLGDRVVLVADAAEADDRAAFRPDGLEDARPFVLERVQQAHVDEPGLGLVAARSPAVVDERPERTGCLGLHEDGDEGLEVGLGGEGDADGHDEDLARIE